TRALERTRTAFARQRRADGLPTASTGIACASGGGLSREDFFESADRALYAAKRSGKDRIVSQMGSSGAGREEETVNAGAGNPSGPEREPSFGERGPLRILVVDDDADLRMLLRTTFEIIDIEVEEADSIAAADAKITARIPDVLVLDVGLPGPDG